MRARPDWRLAVVVMAVALVTALVVLAVPGPSPSAATVPGVALAKEEDPGDEQAGDEQAEQQADGQQEKGRQEKGRQEKGRQEKGQEKDFQGRDQIGKASQDEYVDIARVASNSGQGEGGEFSGGSYSVECALSAHHNSDNPILAPGKRNGAQHTHDYAGNTSANAASDDDSLAEASTTCSNGDQSPIFWPVLRDLAGTGPDVGVDGGSLDGNVGSFVVPSEIDFTLHGHGTRTTEAMPLNMTLVTGAAKAGTENGKGANAKYSCTGSEDRVTDRYPLCPEGSNLQRMFDFPSCWNGQDVDSEDHISHIAFPDGQGECSEDAVPVPALRITLTYDQPRSRGFAIDSFPEQQHDPITDHALLEYLSTERRAQEGVDCINQGRQCTQGAAENVAFTGDPRDRVPPSMTYALAMADMGRSRLPEQGRRAWRTALGIGPLTLDPVLRAGPEQSGFGIGVDSVPGSSSVER